MGTQHAKVGYPIGVSVAGPSVHSHVIIYILGIYADSITDCLVFLHAAHVAIYHFNMQVFSITQDGVSITACNLLTSQDKIQMNLTIVVDAMTYYETLSRVNSTIAADVMACYGTLDRLNSTIAVDAIACYATLDRVITTPDWVNMIITLVRVGSTIVVQ
jgi:hypothetical protein